LFKSDVATQSQKDTSSLAPPIFYVAKKWQLKDGRLPIIIHIEAYLLLTDKFHVVVVVVFAAVVLVC